MIALNNVYKTFETRVSVILENTKPVYFVWCVFAGICLNLLLQICMNPVFYRDSTFYYQMAQSFSIGDWKNAFVLHLPVLYPSLAGIFVCCGIPSMPSMLLVSGIFYALTVFPLFHLLKQFFSEKYALVGVVLFALHYEAAAYYCAPLLDSGRIFFFTSLMALIFSSRGFSWKGLTLCGICYAALSLVRSEGIILAGMLMAAHLAWLIFQCKERFLRAIAGVFYSVAVMLVFCLPRLWQFYIETGIPALEMRQVNAIAQFWSYFFPSYTSSTNQYAYCGGNDMDISLQGFFCNWRFYKNFFTGFFPLYLPFTVWGIVIVLRRKLWDCKYSVLLFLFAAYNLFHFLIEASAGRYFLINCVFVVLARKFYCPEKIAENRTCQFAEIAAAANVACGFCYLFSACIEVILSELLLQIFREIGRKTFIIIFFKCFKHSTAAGDRLTIKICLAVLRLICSINTSA